eukprot:TRINITY_DN16964_c0_g1_i1.p1 TRINITY_DN16964_c0_g1~~TRINITY_DN16964_c0_g1_i1.p1  ORF type:complete len:407 (+),score=95.24 TRINITY_DN16964_c0_g1_i1:85-1305(+)
MADVEIAPVAEETSNEVREEADGNEEPVEGIHYVSNVARTIEEVTCTRREVEEWMTSNSEHEALEDHVAEVYEKSLFPDVLERRSLVQAAVLKQEKAIENWKSRKSDRILRVLPMAGSNKGLSVGTGDSGASRASALAKAVFVEVAELSTDWHLVKTFLTAEEAVRFVIECQPFDYRPAGLAGENFPRFQSSRDAFAHVMDMDPLPDEYVASDAMFHRRLRVRKAAPGETKEEVAAKLAMQKHRTLTGKRASNAPTLHPKAITEKMEPKRWFVEHAGTLFDQCTSTGGPLKTFRNEHAGQRYYVAVTPEVEKRVLAEGYRVKKRASIPCSATPQEALASFTQNEVRNGAKPGEVRKATVLAVAVPQEMGIDVVPHRNGGFIIRSQTLPASCFRHSKRPGGEAAVAT